MLGMLCAGAEMGAAAGKDLLWHPLVLPRLLRGWEPLANTSFKGTESGGAASLGTTDPAHGLSFNLMFHLIPECTSFSAGSQSQHFQVVSQQDRSKALIV